MLFFALLFLLTNVYSLIKGKLFYSVLMESANAEIKKAKGEITEIPKETSSKVGFVIVYWSIYIIIEFIFICSSIKIDPYLYPTLSIIAFIFFGYLINSTKKSKDLATEEGRTKFLVKSARRYTFTGFIRKIVYISYFGYMFGVLLHLIK